MGLLGCSRSRTTGAFAMKNIRNERGGAHYKFRPIAFRLYITASVIILLSGLTASSTAFAGNQENISYFHINAKNLDDALVQLGTQAKMQIVFSSKSMDGYAKNIELNGHYTVSEALAKLLSGKNITFRERGNTIEIIRNPPIKSRIQRPATQDSDPKSTESETPRTRAKRQSENSNRRKSEKGSVRHARLTSVVITGTRIPGVRPVGVPIQTINTSQIEESGYTTTDQLMQSLPDVFRGGAAGATPDAGFQRGANAGFNFTGGSGVDLRGLGSGATLVLFNGHRVAPSGSGFFTDISSIPISAIDHIDVLTDGASAIYGSDAIAGVVNIIPKQQSSGLFTSGRYGIAQGFSQFNANTRFGKIWHGGGFSADANYSGSGALDVRDRSFTSNIKTPTSIFPMSHNIWLSAVGHESVSKNMMVHGDIEYSRARRQTISSIVLPAERSISTVPRWGGSVGLKYHFGTSWMVGVSYVEGEGVEKNLINTFSSSGTQLLSGVREVSIFSQESIEATGILFSLPGGGINLAVGSSYLKESFSHIAYGTGYVLRNGASRNVTSGYAELRIPIVSHANSQFGIKKLTLGVAGRYDKYSDFGETANYKVGLSWYPVDRLQMRGAYSTSFRAPAVGRELVESESGTTGTLLYPILNPQRTANVPVLILLGAVPHLQPETATNLTLGLDYVPPLISSLMLSMNYYNIRYVRQLASAPFEFNALSDAALASAVTHYQSSSPVEALVASSVKNGATFQDATGGSFGADPLAATTYVYDLRTGNLSGTDTSGFDFSVDYTLTSSWGKLNSQLHATYIRDFITQLAPRAPILDEINTVGYPSDIKIIARTVWAKGNLLAAITGNYVGGYRDTTGTSSRRVSSFTTIDIFAGYHWAGSRSTNQETNISISVTNLCNRNPPFVANGALDFFGSHYDAANASPIGRVIAFAVSRRW